MPHCSSVPLFLPHRELATLCREQPTPLCLYCLLNQYVHASAQRSAAAAPNVEKTGSTRVMPVAGCSRGRTPPHRERTTASVESRLTDDTRFRGCEAWSRLTWMEQWKTPLHIEPHYRRWLQRQPETLQAHTGSYTSVSNAGKVNMSALWLRRMMLAGCTVECFRQNMLQNIGCILDICTVKTV